MEANTPQNNKKNAGYYLDFNEVITYFFRKKDPSRPSNFNLRMMHGINKVSILIFLVAVIVMVTRAILRS